MSPFARAAPSLLIALALGACGGSGDGGDDSASADGTLRYSHCDEQTALVFIPSALMPALPEGFAYITPAGDVGVAAVHISGASCQTADGEVAHEVLAFALASLPERYTSPDIATYAIALGGYSDRPESVAQFEAWGLRGLIELGEVSVDAQELPALRIGSVSAGNAAGQLRYSIEAVGPRSVAEPGGGHTRAVYLRDGAVAGVIDAIYSEQTAMIGVGVVTQSGDGPLPVAVWPATGSHAFDYSLEIVSPRLD